MPHTKEQWRERLGSPTQPIPHTAPARLSTLNLPECRLELYCQENGVGTSQRVLLAIPHGLTAPAPAVAIPFYFPEAMLGFELSEARQPLSSYEGIDMMLHLVRRGYVAASADSYHLTYIKSDKARNDFSRWLDAAIALRQDHPAWSGIGKLASDTSRMIDLLASDARVDKTKIGIAGHSLGGKMAFYTGCLDDRISAILASDFGFGWDQSNWREPWYWGNTVEDLIADGMDHTDLLSASQKPFCLIAGEYDNEESGIMMRRAHGYETDSDRLSFINHATGHRPPLWALEKGYDFLDRFLKR